LYVDGASSKRGSEAWIVLEGPDNFQVEMALKFEFKTSNNQAEYEALVAGVEPSGVQCFEESKSFEG